MFCVGEGWKVWNYHVKFSHCHYPNVKFECNIVHGPLKFASNASAVFLCNILEPKIQTVLRLDFNYRWSVPQLAVSCDFLHHRCSCRSKIATLKGAYKTQIGDTKQVRWHKSKVVMQRRLVVKFAKQKRIRVTRWTWRHKPDLVIGIWMCSGGGKTRKIIRQCAREGGFVRHKPS